MSTRTRRWDPRNFDTLEYIAHAQRAVCPLCDAQPDAPCMNHRTNEPIRVPHWQRYKAAEQLENR